MMTSIIGSTGVHIVDINSNAEDEHLKTPSWKISNHNIYYRALNKGYIWNKNGKNLSR